MSQTTLLNHRYAIKAILGHGGFTTTYLAVDAATQRECALKCLSFRKLEDWKTWELFEREANVLKNLHHPQIPKYLDFFTVETEEDVQLYLVQEYAAGQSLAQLVREGKHFTESEAIRLALKILRVLEYLHSLSPPLIHRDLKPGNITLSPDGRASVIDFGAVKDTLASEYAKSRGAPTVVGTYGYMPIEQAEGRALPASDIFALGMTLLYVLAHKEPAEMEKQGLLLDFRPHVNISERFAKIIAKMIAPDWHKRYQTAADVRAALERLRASHARVERGARYERLFATVALIVFLSGFGVYFALRAFTPPALPPAEVETEVPPAVLPTAAPTFTPPPALPEYIPRTTRTPTLVSTPAPAPTLPPAPTSIPTPLPPLSIQGRLLFDGQPITEFTPFEAKFWVGFADTNQNPGAHITSANGAFAIYGLPRGKFMLTVEINANTMNARLFPGDFRGALLFDFMGWNNAEQNVAMAKIIHLTSPQDNDAVMAGGQNCPDLRRLRNPLLFQWEALGAQVVYKYRIVRYHCSNSYAIEEMLSERTEATRVTFPLKPNQPDEYYGFDLTADKNERPLGVLMIHRVSNGAYGESNEYRFRVE